MFIPEHSKSNSPQMTPEAGLFSLVTGYWSLATVLIAILLSIGCADETINNPVAEKTIDDSKPDVIVSTSTNYFPMTVGSRWVYRNRDGSEWVREVTDAENVGSRSYHYFSYDPPIEDNQFAIFQAPMYMATPDSLILKGKIGDINDAIRKTILESNDNSRRWHWFQIFQNGVWKTRKKGLTFLNYYKVREVLHSDSRFLFHLPPAPGKTWKMLNIRLSGSSPIGDTMRHSFESDVAILGTVVHRYSVATPAGIFDDCLNIRYEAKPPSVNTKEFTVMRELTELQKKKLRKHMEVELRDELTTLLTHVNVMPILGLVKSVWLAPGVGPVKIEGAAGDRAVLMDYEIKISD